MCHCPVSSMITWFAFHILSSESFVRKPWVSLLLYQPLSTYVLVILSEISWTIYSSLMCDSGQNQGKTDVNLKEKKSDFYNNIQNKEK
jgi:hypothetical protein